MKNNKVILNWEDTIKNSNKPDTFSRKIIDKSGQQEYHFKDGKLVLKLIDRLTSFLKNIKISKKMNKKILTMDIETRRIKNVTKPYLVGLYDGVNSYSFYLNDYKNYMSLLHHKVQLNKVISYWRVNMINIKFTYII